MHLYLKNKWEIHKLNKELAKVNKTFENNRKTTKNKEESPNDYQSAHDIYLNEYLLYYDQIRFIRTKILMKKANRYNLVSAHLKPEFFRVLYSITI
jgi:hypothetical protein